MADPFQEYSLAPGNPAERSTPVVKDGNAFEVCRGLHVGTGGTVVGKLSDDAANRTFKGIPAGATLPYRFKSIDAASTADDFVALY